MWGSVANIITSTYDNFTQFAGLKDGASHFAKLLTAWFGAILWIQMMKTLTSSSMDISHTFDASCHYRISWSHCYNPSGESGCQWCWGSVRALLSLISLPTVLKLRGLTGRGAWGIAQVLLTSFFVATTSETVQIYPTGLYQKILTHHPEST